MLANFFDKTKPINSIVLSILFLAYFITSLLLHKNLETPYNYWIFSSGSLLLNFSFIFLNSFYFIKNGVSNENLHNTFVLILLYGLLPNTFTDIKFTSISILFLLIYKNLAQLKTKGRKQAALFDAGIYTGIAFLVFEWAILFLPFIIVSLTLAQKLSLKNILSPVLGFLTPLLLFFTYYFITDNTDVFLAKTEFISNLNFSSYGDNTIQLPLIIYTGIIAISILSVLPNAISISGPYRYQYSLAIVMLIFGAITILLSPQKNGAELLIIFTPTSIIIGRFFKVVTNQKIKDALLFILSFCSLFFLIKNA